MSVTYTITDGQLAPIFTATDQVIPTSTISLPHTIRYDFTTDLNSVVDISVTAVS